MKKGYFRFFIFIILILLVFPQALTACNYPGSLSNPTEIPGIVNTHVALTIEAQPPTLTFTPQPTNVPSSTPVPADIPTQQSIMPTVPPPTQPLVVPTVIAPPTIPKTPMITAQVNTNCRMGPSSQYPSVGALIVGQTSTVRARDASGQWWVIDNPQKLGSTCWIWSQTTTVQGNTASLPIAAAPPLAIGAAATVSFVTVISCGGVPTAVFVVRNTGDTPLDSAKITAKDTNNGKSLFSGSSNTPFMPSSGGCTASMGSLPPNQTAYMPAGFNSKAVAGHNVQSSITLCTGENLSGKCITSKLQYTLP